MLEIYFEDETGEVDGTIEDLIRELLESCGCRRRVLTGERSISHIYDR